MAAGPRAALRARDEDIARSSTSSRNAYRGRRRGPKVPDVSPRTCSGASTGCWHAPAPRGTGPRRAVRGAIAAGSTATQARRGAAAGAGRPRPAAGTLAVGSQPPCEAPSALPPGGRGSDPGAGDGEPSAAHPFRGRTAGRGEGVHRDHDRRHHEGRRGGRPCVLCRVHRQAGRVHDGARARRASRS